MRRRKDSGTTIIELVLVIGMIAILATVFLVNLQGRKGKTELTTTTQQIAALLREAQSRSVAQSSGTSWGVHFENSTTTASFYALFNGTYSTSSRIGYYRLPATVNYSTSSLASGASKEVTFTQITGTASASTSITIFSVTDMSQSSTISVASSGAVGF